MTVLLMALLGIYVDVDAPRIETVSVIKVAKESNLKAAATNSYVLIDKAHPPGTANYKGWRFPGAVYGTYTGPFPGLPSGASFPY